MKKINHATVSQIAIDLQRYADSLTEETNAAMTQLAVFSASNANNWLEAASAIERLSKLSEAVSASIGESAIALAMHDVASISGAQREQLETATAACSTALLAAGALFARALMMPWLESGYVDGQRVNFSGPFFTRPPEPLH